MLPPLGSISSVLAVGPFFQHLRYKIDFVWPSLRFFRFFLCSYALFVFRRIMLAFFRSGLSRRVKM